jgi:peptide/nickel transport system substrate-binding protein
MMNRKSCVAAALGTVMMVIVSACGPAATSTAIPTRAPTAQAPTAAPTNTEAATATAAAGPSNPDTVIIGTTDKVASLDSADAYTIRDWEVLENISEGLLKWKPGTVTLEPGLATDMGAISSDGLTYTFTLKDGIKFGDGAPLTATVYAAQLNRLLTIGPSCPNDVADSLAVPYVKSITAPDDKTIMFTLKSKIGFFPEILAGAPYVASDPNIFKADACNLFPPAPIYGVGPWFVSQYDPDKQMVFEPNPYYTGDLKPRVKQVVVRLFSDPNSMAMAVQKDEIDVAWRLFSPDQLYQLKSVSSLKIGTISGGRIQTLVLNHTMKPFDDPNVDKAIASAIDRNEIADTVYGGQVVPMYSQVPPGYLGATEAFNKMYGSPNLDEARNFLEASNYSATNPVKIELWYPPEHYGASTAALMQVVKKQLEATGEMQVTLKAQEWSTYVPALTGGKAYGAGILGWIFDYPDTSNYLDPFVYNRGEGTNVTLPNTGSDTGIPINDKAKLLVYLLKQADTETNPPKRADLYQHAQDLYADLVVTVPLFYATEHVVYQTSVHSLASAAFPETLNIGPNILFLYSFLTKG